MAKPTDGELTVSWAPVVLCRSLFQPGQRAGACEMDTVHCVVGSAAKRTRVQEARAEPSGWTRGSKGTRRGVACGSRSVPRALVVKWPVAATLQGEFSRCPRIVREDLLWVLMNRTSATSDNRTAKTFLVLTHSSCVESGPSRGLTGTHGDFPTGRSGAWVSATCGRPRGAALTSEGEPAAERGHRTPREGFLPPAQCPRVLDPGGCGGQSLWGRGVSSTGDPRLVSGPPMGPCAGQVSSSLV